MIFLIMMNFNLLDYCVEQSLENSLFTREKGPANNLTKARQGL